MSTNILKRLGAILALTMTLAFAGSANAGVLGFEFGIDADGNAALQNTSTGSYSIVSLTIDFMSAGNTTYFDTAGPGSTGFSNLGGVAAILPDDLASDGSGAVTFTYAPGTFTNGLFSQLGFDLDQPGDETGSPYAAYIEVSYFDGSTTTDQHGWLIYPNPTINGQTYEFFATNTSVTPIPPTLLLLGSGLLGIFGYRRMRG